jgi:hypothetical protein
MRWFYYGKDGGYESTVWGFWLFEIKSLCSIVLLKFENGSRDAYHSHAFNSVSWVLWGKLREHHLRRLPAEVHPRSWRPVITRRKTFHKVTSEGRTWVLSFRGPWAKHWQEYHPKEHTFTMLASGRKTIAA